MSTAIDQTQIVEDDWRGLYKDSWSGVIAPESFAHPAKFSRALIRFIYQHVIDCGWIHPGDRVVDPFGGVALGGFDAMRHGLHWTGCELEAKFHGLGNQNIALWNERFSRMPNWGTAVLVQGDSRHLSSVLDEAGLTVSSPPYVTDQFGGGGNKHDKVIDAMKAGYGASEGQLGAMKEGDLQATLSISSPPYVAISPEKSSRSVDYAKQYETYRSQGGGASFEKFVATQELHSQGYGNSDGQLSAMRKGQFDANLHGDNNGRGRHSKRRDETPLSGSDESVEIGRAGAELSVTSPPYESNEQHGRPSAKDKAFFAGRTIGEHGCAKYGDAENNLGNQRGEDFWSASRLILEQLYQIITPGGHAVFVVKAFVRNKQIVDFPAQWAQLCEAVGFKLLHDHHALLTEEYGTQTTFHGEDKTLTIARKSFFRRLAESKGSPRIDWESVLCFEK